MGTSHCTRFLRRVEIFADVKLNGCFSEIGSPIALVLLEVASLSRLLNNVYEGLLEGSFS